MTHGSSQNLYNKRMYDGEAGKIEQRNVIFVCLFALFWGNLQEYSADIEGLGDR